MIGATGPSGSDKLLTTESKPHQVKGFLEEKHQRQIHLLQDFNLLEEDFGLYFIESHSFATVLLFPLRELPDGLLNNLMSI